MPEQLHQYHLSKTLSEKYSRTTYLASPSNEAERQVVLMVWAASFFRLPREREEWLLNAERIQHMQHPHLLPLLDLGIDEEQPFLVRDYLPHASLRSRLRKISPHRLPLQEALTSLLEVGQALTYAHERNIIHGNIKPENILFNAQGHALLTDFLPVRRRDALIRDQAAEEYAFCYLAPEQFSGTCNAGSDQYALGCLAYELLAGQVPFAAQGLASMIGAHSDAQPVPLSESVPDMLPALEAAVMKTLAKDPTKRFVDCLLFLEVLQSIVSSSPVFPFPKAAPARSTTTLSHSKPSANANIVVSPIRKRAAKASASEQAEQPQAFFNSVAERADAGIASGISNVSLPEWAEIIAPSESVVSIRESDQFLSLPSEDADSSSNGEKKNSNELLKEQSHTQASVTMLRAHEIDMWAGGDATMTNAASPDFVASPCRDDAVFSSEADRNANQRGSGEDADGVWLTNLFEEQESHDLPGTGSVSLEQELHEAGKEKEQKIIISSLNKKNRRLRRQKQHTRRPFLGLLLLCLVIAASGTYAASFPWGTSKPERLVRPTQVVKEVLIPVQEDSQLATPTATVQATPHISIIPTVISTPTPTSPPVIHQVITIDDRVMGTGLNQFNYAYSSDWNYCTDCGDVYDGTATWAGNGGDYVTLTFTGIQIKFYGILDPSHGIGAVSIDGGSETMINTYGPNNVGDQLQWTSPELPAGTHTFKLRVTGTQDSRSTGPFVAVDRVDILS